MKRTLEDFLTNELHFEHLRAIYRHYMGQGGYERNEMVRALSEYLTGPEGSGRLAEQITDDEAELLYVLRQVGGLAPRRWLFHELAERFGEPVDTWRGAFCALRDKHVTFLIGRGTAYLPEGISDVLGRRISGEPRRRRSADVVPGASVVRQSVQGLVIALLNHLHQVPPRVMAEEERIWKRDLEGMADFFSAYLYESGNGGSGQIRGRVSRLVELLRKMGFMEKRGKRLYIDRQNWTDWSARHEVERQSIFLSFLCDHYENIPVALEALVDWKSAGWIPLERLAEAVRYRTLRSAFHVLRVRPQSEVKAHDPGPRWVAACVHLLADLGLVYTGTDPRGRVVARATDGGIAAWGALHSARSTRGRRKRAEEMRSYAQPNFELLIPEESSATLHRRVGAVAELRSLDRFWTYVLTSRSVARGIEEGMTGPEVLATLDELVGSDLPSNVREAVAGWAETAWWVEADGRGVLLRAEASLFESILAMEGLGERFDVEDHSLRPCIPRRDAARWLEERGIRVVEEDRDLPGELGRDAHDVYRKALDAWRRRLEHGGEGTPSGSYWENVVPVDPVEREARRT